MGGVTSPLDVPERGKPRSRGRLQLILILLVVLGPMILATSMYKLQFWVPEGRSYHGEMIGNGQSRADIGIDAAHCQVHLGQPPGGVVAFLTIDGDVADAATVLLHEAFGLYEHAPGATAWVIHPTLVRL